MANVAITIPDALVPRLTAAARATYPQYSALSDVATFRAITADLWRNLLVTYEGVQAEIAARPAYSAAYTTAANRALTDGQAIG